MKISPKLLRFNLWQQWSIYLLLPDLSFKDICSGSYRPHPGQPSFHPAQPGFHFPPLGFKLLVVHKQLIQLTLSRHGLGTCALPMLSQLTHWKMKRNIMLKGQPSLQGKVTDLSHIKPRINFSCSNNFHQNVISGFNGQVTSQACIKLMPSNFILAFKVIFLIKKIPSNKHKDLLYLAD